MLYCSYVLLSMRVHDVVIVMIAVVVEYIVDCVVDVAVVDGIVVVVGCDVWVCCSCVQ